LGTAGLAAAAASAVRASTATLTAAGAAAVAATGGLAGIAEVLELLGGQAGPGARAARQPAGDLRGDAEVGVEVRGGVVGLRRLLEPEAEGLVDEPPARHVVPVDEGDRRAGLTGAAGAPDAVEVGLL